MMPERALTLIFPHQLFADHPALVEQQDVALVEDTLFFGDLRYPARFHKQKLALHRACMKVYADSLLARGWRVRYVDYQATLMIDGLIEEFARAGYGRIQWADPVDDVLERRVRRACRRAGLVCDTKPTPAFLTPLEWGKTVVGERPPYRMASFYMAQRRRLNILMDHGKPQGGAWSFDAENRKKWPKDRPPPPVPRLAPDPCVAAALAYVRDRFPENPGDLNSFNYPVTHAQAAQWLADFLENRLVGFGTYEDAMVPEETLLHHSLLTPLLNIGLLTPRQIVDATLAHAREHDVPLNDLEGFIRQVIGWREFMMLMYRQIGVPQRNSNFWQHTHPLPASFYSATTGMAPVDTVIRRLRQTGYTHHIERLMVLGNFMLLCEIDPHAVYRWFMEMYIDAYDWVMVPNVYGMSQFADGGWLCTKPYISGSNYLRKQSTFPRGDWCAVWDGLFWRFIDRHRDFFSSQPRLSMMVRQLERMPSARLQAHLATAQAYLERLHGDEEG
jgi:deoxyribodipyrimidine photolyase-related protein